MFVGLYLRPAGRQAPRPRQAAIGFSIGIEVIFYESRRQQEPLTGRPDRLQQQLQLHQLLWARHTVDLNLA